MMMVRIPDFRPIRRHIDKEGIGTHLGPLSPCLPPNLNINEDHEKNGEDKEERDMDERVDGPPEGV